MWCNGMYYKHNLDYQYPEKCEEHIIRVFLERNRAELLATLAELCAIPAPSHREEKRAEYCKNWLERNGAEGAYIDEELTILCFVYEKTKALLSQCLCVYQGMN